jgi:hypothetical protein
MTDVESIEVIKPLFKWWLHPSDKWYCLQRDRNKGEQDLRTLCRKSDREYAWIFYEDTNMWLHIPSIPDKKEINGRTKSMGIKMPGIYESSLGKQPTHYHIHPNAGFAGMIADLQNLGLSKDLASAGVEWNAVKPSREDLTLIHEIGRPYEHRIVTDFGVTSFRAGSEIEKLPDLLKQEDLFLNPITAQTPPSAISREALRLLEERLQGSIILKYMPFQ